MTGGDILYYSEEGNYIDELKKRLEPSFQVEVVRDPDEAVLRVSGKSYEAVLIESLADVSRQSALIQRLREADPNVPILFESLACLPDGSQPLTLKGHATLCIPRGGVDFSAVDLVLSETESRDRENLDRLPAGRSDAIFELTNQIKVAAESDSPVLILGEHGVGKTLAARLIHYRSFRRQHPFVVLHCTPPGQKSRKPSPGEKSSVAEASVLTPELWEQAAGGTLLLKDIFNLDQTARENVLTLVTQSSAPAKEKQDQAPSPSSVRLIASGESLPEHHGPDRLFFNILFHWPGYQQIDVPPLKNHLKDLPELTVYFLNHYAAVHGEPPKRVTLEGLTRMQDYSWPGNVRELEYLCYHVASITEGRYISVETIMSVMPDPEQVPLSIATAEEIPLDYKEFKKMKSRVRSQIYHQLDRMFLDKAVARWGRNFTQISRMTGCTREYLYYMERSQETD